MKGDLPENSSTLWKINWHRKGSEIKTKGTSVVEVPHIEVETPYAPSHDDFSSDLVWQLWKYEARPVPLPL